MDGFTPNFTCNEKERRFARKRGGGEKEMGGGEGGRWCLAFFKGITNSLSALVIHLQILRKSKSYNAHSQRQL